MEIRSAGQKARRNRARAKSAQQDKANKKL